MLVRALAGRSLNAHVRTLKRGKGVRDAGAGHRRASRSTPSTQTDCLGSHVRGIRASPTCACCARHALQQQKEAPGAMCPSSCYDTRLCACSFPSGSEGRSLPAPLPPP